MNKHWLVTCKVPALHRHNRQQTAINGALPLCNHTGDRWYNLSVRHDVPIKAQLDHGWQVRRLKRLEVTFLLWHILGILFVMRYQLAQISRPRLHIRSNNYTLMLVGIHRTQAAQHRLDALIQKALLVDMSATTGPGSF